MEKYYNCSTGMKLNVQGVTSNNGTNASPHSNSSLEDIIKEKDKLIQRLKGVIYIKNQALKPFQQSVFNDNRDMTVGSVEDLASAQINAYFAYETQVDIEIAKGLI